MKKLPPAAMAAAPKAEAPKVDTAKASADLLGDNILFGLAKPDGGVRPIGVGAAIRRLANRAVLRDESDTMGKVFTETPVPLDIRRQYGLPDDAKCNTPMNFGVGVKGGAEIAILNARIYLERFPDHAMFSDDKCNGFNCISRSAIFEGLRRWFPHLIPAARLWYRRRARLFTFGEQATGGGHRCRGPGTRARRPPGGR